MSNELHHPILGAGGVGGLMAACLARSGAEVTLIVRPDSLAKYPEQLQLESPFGKFSVPIARAKEVPPCDVLWITVKATQLENSLAAINHPESIKAIVPLLNGIDHIALLRARYGHEKIIPATIAVESERVAPGHIIHRSPFARLNVSAMGKALLGGTIEQLQKTGFECRFIDDEPTLMWGKLVFLAPFALTTTAANRNVGEILSDPEWRNLGMACIQEVCAVAAAEGARIDVQKVLTGVSGMPGAMRSSMQKDVEQGKMPELDAIAGPVLRAAERHGIEVPVTKKLVAQVERKAQKSHSLV